MPLVKTSNIVNSMTETAVYHVLRFIVNNIYVVGQQRMSGAAALPGRRAAGRRGSEGRGRRGPRMGGKWEVLAIRSKQSAEKGIRSGCAILLAPTAP